jgi:hypothetical protein
MHHHAVQWDVVDQLVAKEVPSCRWVRGGVEALVKRTLAHLDTTLTE